MAKKTLWDGAKIMMVLSRKAKKSGSKLYVQRVSHEIFKEIVYISNGHVIFPIEAKVFDENALKYGYPINSTSQDLYKMMRDSYNENEYKAVYTPLIFDNKANLTTRIIRYDKGYAMLNVDYTDLVNYLPTALQNNGQLKAKDDKSPFTNYEENIDLGYCILPIYNSKGKGNLFEKTIKDLSCIVEW